jgi:hypothetical protein
MKKLLNIAIITAMTVTTTIVPEAAMADRTYVEVNNYHGDDRRRYRDNKRYNKHKNKHRYKYRAYKRNNHYNEHRHNNGSTLALGVLSGLVIGQALSNNHDVGYSTNYYDNRYNSYYRNDAEYYFRTNRRYNRPHYRINYRSNYRYNDRPIYVPSPPRGRWVNSSAANDTWYKGDDYRESKNSSTCLQTREYTTTVEVGGRTVPAYGTSCLQADGSWKLGKAQAVPSGYED